MQIEDVRDKKEKTRLRELLPGSVFECANGARVGEVFMVCKTVAPNDELKDWQIRLSDGMLFEFAQSAPVNELRAKLEIS